MSKLHLLAYALAGSVAVGAPVLAQDIVVSSNTAIAAVSRDLDRQLDSAARGVRDTHGDGFAIVRFERGADGRPANVTLYRRSGSSSVDRLARTAVRRLGARDALPDTGVAGQAFQANIVLANSEHSYHALAADLARFETARLASAPAERTVLALSAGGTRKAS